MKSHFNVQPVLSLLTTEQKEEVHGYSVRILEDTGIRVECRQALNIFEKTGGVRVSGQVVHISRELIAHSIQSAPAGIQLYNKAGNPAFILGEGQGRETYFGIGVTNSWFQDIESSEVEPFTRGHTQHCTMLGNLLENFDMISTPGIPSDVPPGRSDIYSVLDMYANTIKPMVLLISGEGKLKDAFSLLHFLHGDLSERPFCIPYVNPITPLVLNRSTSDKMITTISEGLPLMYSNYSMYGGTTPFGEGGSLSLLNAELLAGLVFSQAVREGSPVILGSLPAAFNMSTMGSFYTPVSYLLNLACAEMMDHYHVPHCGTSGSNNGRGADLPAAGNLWMNHLSSCLGKVGCAPFVGGNFDSLAFSPAMVVLSDQIIGQARRFARGFQLDEGMVDLNEIRERGPGGDFFTTDQTLASLDRMAGPEILWPVLSLETWKALGMPSAEAELRRYVGELFRKARMETAKSADLIRLGEDYICKTFRK